MSQPDRSKADQITILDERIARAEEYRKRLKSQMDAQDRMIAALELERHHIEHPPTIDDFVTGLENAVALAGD